MTTLTGPTTHTLDVLGAILTYDIRTADAESPAPGQAGDPDAFAAKLREVLAAD